MPSTSALSPAFNDFLFATVCEERSETPLSVISALARLDLDPWTEAADLARMPTEGAARRLCSLLARVLGDSPATPDRAVTAATLVALLPRSARTESSSPPPAVGAEPAPWLNVLRLMSLMLFGSMALSVLLADLAPRAGASGSAPNQKSALTASP